MIHRVHTVVPVDHLEVLTHVPQERKTSAAESMIPKPEDMGHLPFFRRHVNPSRGGEEVSGRTPVTPFGIRVEIDDAVDKCIFNYHRLIAGQMQNARAVNNTPEVLDRP